MKISTKGRYALRVMIDLAINNKGEYISIKEISERQEISNKYLEQIISKLNKAGYLKAARGNNGGYMLTRLPKDYTIGDILRVTEGNLEPIKCISENCCNKKAECKSYSFWKELDNVIETFVDSKTLEDLIK